jgi:MFS family permease
VEAEMSSLALVDEQIPTRIKLSALWASVMFCYAYGDYFELYVPGKLEEMLQGEMALGSVTQGLLLGTSSLMALPSLMIFLSLVLPPTVSRWLNIGAGLFYATIMLLILFGGVWAFYMLFASIEVVLTLLVVWYAWRWPRAQAMQAQQTVAAERREEAAPAER